MRYEIIISIISTYIIPDYISSFKISNLICCNSELTRRIWIWSSNSWRIINIKYSSITTKLLILVRGGGNINLPPPSSYTKYTDPGTKVRLDILVLKFVFDNLLNLMLFIFFSEHRFCFIRVFKIYLAI